MSATATTVRIEACGVEARRVGWGVGLSAAAKGVGAARAVLLVPFFLAAWGSDVYGTWIALTAVASNLSLLDFGGQSYIGNLLATHHAHGDEGGFRRRLSEGVSLFLTVGVVAMVVAAATLTLGASMALPGIGRPLTSGEAQVLFWLAANALLLSVPGGVYVTAYRASGRFVRGQTIGTAGILANTVACVALLLMAVPPQALAAATFAVSLAVTIAIVVDTRRVIPGCRGVRLSWTDVKQGSRHLGRSLLYWVISISTAVRQDAVVLLLAAVAPPPTVAAFAAHRVLAGIPGQLGSLLQGPLLPELSFLWARRQNAELKTALLGAVRVVTTATAFIAMLIWLGAPLVFSRWTAGVVPLHMTLLAVLLGQAVVTAAWTSSTWGLQATNRHNLLAFCACINAAVAVGGALLWVRPYGVLGAAAAGLVADVMCGLVAAPALSAKLLGMSWAQVGGQLLIACLLAAIVISCAISVSQVVPGWYGVAAFGLLGAGLAHPRVRAIMVPA